MSVNLMSAVFSASDISSTEKLVLLAMADFANDDGLSIYPSIETLAHKTALAERTVQRTIQNLCDKGIVSVQVQGNGRYNTNEYRIYKAKLTIEKGDSTSKKGDSEYRKGDRQSKKGDTESPDPSLTIIESSLTSDNENIFTLYSSTIGPITANLKDDLVDAQNEYPFEWIEKAFKIAAENNARNWKYVSRVLENMKNKGVDWKPGKQNGKSYQQTKKRSALGI